MSSNSLSPQPLPGIEASTCLHARVIAHSQNKITIIVLFFDPKQRSHDTPVGDLIQKTCSVLVNVIVIDHCLG